MLARTSLLLLALSLCACREGRKAPAPADATPPAASDASAKPEGPLGGSRPLRYVAVPKSYDAARPSPLVLVLHGYGSTGAQHASMFDLGGVVEDERVIVMAPDGLIDSRGMRFWNAVPSCCDFDGKKPDDVAYLRGLVDEAKQRYAIDAKRVYVVGHSNGGAMALRLACEAADVFAAAIDLAAPFSQDIPAMCQPSQAVSVRVMHGTDDAIVPYQGGQVASRVNPNAARFPIASAEQKAAGFAKVAGCADQPSPGPDLDFELSLPGPETKVLRWDGCTDGAAVELWSIHGMGHSPRRTASFRSAWDFLAAHAKK